MAEITAEAAKSMSCTKLTKLGLYDLVAADRGEPCPECKKLIKRGFGDAGLCTLKVVATMERSRRTKKKDPAPSPTLQPYPVCRTSLVVPTAEDALSIYGPCYAGKRVDPR